METNTELLNRIEAHIKGRLAVAESRAASSELYEGKKIAYNSILGVVNGLRADCAAQAQLVPSDVQEAKLEKEIAEYEKKFGNINEMGGYEILMFDDEFRDTLRHFFAAGMLAERERLMKEAPVADVIEMRGSIGPFKDYPFMLSLGFRKIPNIEFHGGKVRVIIEEIK